MILNLTQHAASPDQLAAGVADLPPDERERLVDLLTFDAAPDAAEIAARADEIANIAISSDLWDGAPDEVAPHGTRAMIGGALWLMAPLAHALTGCGLVPQFAFSRRESIDGPDGRKASRFVHAGWVPAL